MGNLRYVNKSDKDASRFSSEEVNQAGQVVMVSNHVQNSSRGFFQFHVAIPLITERSSVPMKRKEKKKLPTESVGAISTDIRL